MTVTLAKTALEVDEMSPTDAWDALAAEPNALLVDVRSEPEWRIAGRPDLEEIGRRVAFVEWQVWPTMAPNLGFLSDLEQQLGDEMPRRIFFLCKAGPRSAAAALEFSRQMRARGVNLHCTNIADGFEGERDANGQRSRLTGWKAAGLPWCQD